MAEKKARRAEQKAPSAEKKARAFEKKARSAGKKAPASEKKARTAGKISPASEKKARRVVKISPATEKKARAMEKISPFAAGRLNRAVSADGAFSRIRVGFRLFCARLIRFPGKPAARPGPSPAQEAAFSPHAFRRADTARSIRRRPRRTLAARFKERSGYKLASPSQPGPSSACSRVRAPERSST